MTRANLNFVWQPWGDHPRTLHYYWNGDQSPRGLRDFFDVKQWLSDKSNVTPEGFKNWIRTAYAEFVKQTDRPCSTNDVASAAPSDFEPRLISHPCIYYDEAGFPTDYSYVFEQDERVRVFEWDQLIFKGTVAEFLDWLEQQT